MVNYIDVEMFFENHPEYSGEKIKKAILARAKNYADEKGQISENQLNNLMHPCMINLLKTDIIAMPKRWDKAMSQFTCAA